jgi:predicted transcriptional regulator
MTPAEKAAKTKPRRNPRPGVKAVWKCGLRKKRIDLGLSLRDVEKGTGVSAPTISRAERGDDLILSHAVALARYFGVAVEELWLTIQKEKP